MLFKITFEGPRQGKDGQYRHDRGKNSVSDEEREIDGSDPTLPGEMQCAHVEMIIKVAGQKDDRGTESREHAKSVGGSVLVADEIEPDGQEDSAGAVKGGVQWWEECVIQRFLFVLRR